jgi:cardiolipin synthase (CMP-forming)
MMAAHTYSARDLFRIPGLLTLVRVPLAIAFVLLVHRPLFAFVVLLLAGASDLLDGWYARRFGQSSATGALADAVVDKVFVGIVAVSLVVSGTLGPAEVLLLGVRDFGEIMLGAFLLETKPAELARPRKALSLSKATTALQFVTVAVALAGLSTVGMFAFVTAVLGALAVAEYWSVERAPRS